jgi:hypothetical protein
MTFTTTGTSLSFPGDGGSRRFNLDFAFFDAADLLVVERRISDGMETPRTLGLHYAVEGGGGGTGAVIAAIAPPAGVEWHVRRRTQRVQAADYQENDAFSAAGHERALDRLQAQLQEVAAEQERTLRLSPLAAALPPLPPLQDGAFLRAATDPARLDWMHLGPSTLLVTPFMAELLDDPTREAAWETLGLGAGSGTVSSVNVVPAGAAAGLAFGGGPVTGSGAITATLAFPNLPEETTPNAADDQVAIYSAAGAQHRRVKIASLPVPPVADGGITTPKLANAAVTNAKLAAGAAIQGAANATTGGGQIFFDRTGDTLRFRRIVVAKSITGPSTYNALSDASLAIATSGDTITITLTIQRVLIDSGTGGGGGA